MERVYEVAFAEVDEIFKIMPIDLLSKIPVQFRKTISENKAKDYKIEINEPLEKEKLKQETIAILGLIYRDFLASPDEREELQARDAEEIEKIKEELSQQYDIEKILKKKKTKYEDVKNDDITDLIVYKEQGFLKKLFFIIKNLFSKK